MQKLPIAFDGGVNLEIDPHLLKPNEWLLLKNLWPYKSKMLGSRPSLLHEQDILPVPPENWNGFLSLGTAPAYPAQIPNYGQWFRHLTPLRVLFLGSLERMAIIAVCNQNDLVTIREQFEGTASANVTLVAGDVILMLTPNDLNPGDAGSLYPKITAVRLGSFGDITPSLVEFNGRVYAANKDCDYVVEVVQSSTIVGPSPATWPNIDYRFTKVNFGPTNTGIKFDGVITYRNRFVYWKNNKIWFSDPFQPSLIFEDAEQTAYLGVFFDSNLSEPITAMYNLYTDAIEKAGQSVLAIWTRHGMIMLQGEPATTVALSPEQIFSDCQITELTLRCGCISQASIVKTKFGLIWCGAETVWFMANGNLPIEVGNKIMPRIKDQSFSSSGRIFATYDDECYRLTINSPGNGFNPYEALNEMWCLSFVGDIPNKENASWFGPQVFTNTDNPLIAEEPAQGGPSGLFCCAKLTNINDDKTWYIQPYSCTLGVAGGPGESDGWGTRLGLASLSEYLGVDITSPFRMAQPLNPTYNYSLGAIFQLSRGINAEDIPYNIEYLVVEAGVYNLGLDYIQIYTRGLTPLYSKRPLTFYVEGVDLMPEVHKIEVVSANLVFNEPDLVKLISGYDLTFKTLNPIIIKSSIWPWQPKVVAANVETLESPVNVPSTPENQLGGLFNEPILTTRRIMPPSDATRFNGLEAQYNIEQSDEKIIISNQNVVNPKWGLIRVSVDNINWVEFQLFDFDSNGIAKYDSALDLLVLLQNKIAINFGLIVDIDVVVAAGFAIRINAGDGPLFIDLTAQGWEWFGFVPTNLDNGWGTNIISNDPDSNAYLYATGPIPPCTPQSIHLAKFSAIFDYLRADPR